MDLNIQCSCRGFAAKPERFSYMCLLQVGETAAFRSRAGAVLKHMKLLVKICCKLYQN